MNKLRHKIATLKHWQLLLLFFVPVFIMIVVSPGLDYPVLDAITVSIGNDIFICIYLMWLWVIAFDLDNSPVSKKDRIAILVIILSFVISMLELIYIKRRGWFYEPSWKIMAVTAPFYLAATLAILSLINKATKKLQQIHNRHSEKQESYGFFLMLMFFMWPFGIFFLQPIVNAEVAAK